MQSLNSVILKFLRSLSFSVLQWASVLSQVAVEQQFIHHSLMDNLEHTNNDLEKRSITGSLRNLSRHARDKNKLGEFLPMLNVNKPLPLLWLLQPVVLTLDWI